MGNQQSNKKKTDSVSNSSQTIDFIATNYILTMDFQSLTKLYEKEYCDNLVVLTSNIIEKYFNPLEISYLAQRIKNGQEVNEIEKDKILYFNKQTLEGLNLQNPLKKKRICISIAKFYIKIAHIFAAIVMTINPIYVYKNAQGEVVKTPLNKKSEIPNNIPRKIYKLNICDQRINSLSRGKGDTPLLIPSQDKNKGDTPLLIPSSNKGDAPLQDKNKGDAPLLIPSQDKNKNQDNNSINIHPNICSFNKNYETLMDEPGIPELMQLYYDDKYDYVSGQFLQMSEASKKDYEKDLLIFYNVFTGNSATVLPPEIKSFSDIKLRNYKDTPDCQGSNPLFNQTLKGSTSNKLFSQYADNIKKMVKNANDNQKALLGIINKLFVYSKPANTNTNTTNTNTTNNTTNTTNNTTNTNINTNTNTNTNTNNTNNTNTNTKEIRINPQLTEDSLQQIVVDARNLIMKLYITCEIDYTNGIKIYEAIIEEKILETSQNQINYFNKLSDSLREK
jgi:hypothetical protein